MALSEIDAKQIQKISNVTGTVPTMGVSPDYTDGTWSTEDIYRGEFFLNDPDGRLWIGTVNGPIEIGAGIWSRVGEDIVAVENAITSPLIYPTSYRPLMQLVTLDRLPSSGMICTLELYLTATRAPNGCSRR